MPEAFAALLPPLAAMPAVIVMLLIAVGCGALLNARLSRRSRSHDANAEIPIAAGHAPEDHDLLWRALGRHVMINVADADARTVSINGTFAEATGYGRDEVIGRSLQDFLFVPGTVGRESVVQAIKSQGQWTGETAVRRKDGSRFWTRTTIVGVCNEAGELVRTVAVRTDITKNKVSQDDAQKRLLLERLNDEVYVFDAGDLSLHYLNRSALNFLGWGAEDYRGRTLADTNSNFDEAGFRARVARLQSGEVDQLTYESLHEKRPVEISLQLDRTFDGSERFIGVIRDITARKLAETEKANFVSTVSHELRAPLASVLGALKLMASGKMGQIEERPLGLIQVALRNVERLVVMINDLLDLEKVAAGKMEMKLQPTDVSKVLEDALASNESYAAEFGVRLIRIGTKAPVIVDANHDRLVQVLNNLLSNAAKFSPRGETVEAELRNTRGAVQIIVRDHGAGIPEEYGDRLFQRFVQAGTPSQGRPSGTGLGLSIAKAIVERHGGTISFTSAVGQGTTFCVELPHRQDLRSAA